MSFHSPHEVHMSVAIETTEELLTLLKKLGVKVTSVDELRSLLMTINANYNPQAARTRMAKLIAISVPCTLGPIAGLVSVVLAESGRGTLVGPSFVGALAVIWGACALVSVTALIFGLALLGRRSRAEDKPPLGNSAVGDERVMAAIGRDLSL
jgi:hypothetical protein